MNLPNGIVTFVFSDIEGSTRLWETDPIGMRASLARHDEIVQREIAAAGGHVFKHTGDGFGAAFDGATSGIAAAARIAAAIDGEAWPGPALSCRIGVHSGEAEPSNGDYFGATVTRTARVMDAGNGGQILVSHNTRTLQDAAPPSTTFLDMGEHRLKDLREPIRLYRLTGRGADDDRPLRTLEIAPHNLPIQLTTFVGREREIEEVSDLIQRSRLVTLTGIGGVGKTRLSLQVAAEFVGEFDDGAWFVELAPLGEPGLLADEACAALGVPQDSSRSAEERLVEFLSDRRALLVIDNCEHLIEDVATLVDTVLRACPEVHVLATSREGLAVNGEVLWRVPSLRVDADAAAIGLFADRARLVQPSFSVSDANRETVSDLCARLDGIPLAIELATARLKVLTVEQIAQHLDDRFRLLTGGARTSVERQRTLKAMMDWSYDLLSDREQALLRRLAVFVDGFTYEAAEDVTSGEELDRFEVLDLLGRLVEASLVIFEPERGPRYRLLETVRQYALDELVETGEADEARLRHAEHYRGRSEHVRDALDGGDFSVMQAAAGDDLGNFRAALTWATESGHGLLALELAVNLRTYFWNRVMYAESLKWIAGALDLVEDDASDLVPLGVSYGLNDAGNIGDADRAFSLAERGRRLFERASDAETKGVLANAMATMELTRDIREADRLQAEAARLLRAADHPLWFAPVQNRFITAWQMSDRSAEDEILQLVDEAEQRGTAIHGDVVRMAFRTLAEDYDHVIDFVDGHEMRDEFEDGILHVFRAQCERASGRLEDAISSIERSASVPGRFADGWIGWQRGMAHLQLGDSDEAVTRFHAPRAFTDRFPIISERAHVAWFSALVSERREDYEHAAVLLGFGDRISEESGARTHPFDQRLIDAAAATVHQHLGEARHRALRSRGAATEWNDLRLVEGVDGAPGPPP